MTDKKILDASYYYGQTIQLVDKKNRIGIAKSALHLDELPCFATRKIFTNQPLEDIQFFFLSPQHLNFDSNDRNKCTYGVWEFKCNEHWIYKPCLEITLSTLVNPKKCG